MAYKWRTIQVVNTTANAALTEARDFIGTSFARVDNCRHWLSLEDEAQRAQYVAEVMEEAVLHEVETTPEAIRQVLDDLINICKPMDWLKDQEPEWFERDMAEWLELEAYAKERKLAS